MPFVSPSWCTKDVTQPREDEWDWQGPSVSLLNPSWTLMNATQLDKHPAHMALVSCAVSWTLSIWVVAIRSGPLSMLLHGRLGLLIQTASLHPFVPSRISKGTEAR